MRKLHIAGIGMIALVGLSSLTTFMVVMDTYAAPNQSQQASDPLSEQAIRDGLMMDHSMMSDKEMSEHEPLSL